jgi:tetratricopeptide (TPR) repeat protein
MPRVFLSSVFQGSVGGRPISEVRRKVAEVLRLLDYEVWLGEELGDTGRYDDLRIRALCLSGIRESDIYLGIFPPTLYGSDPLGRSFTQLEYEDALDRGLPRFLYILPNDGLVYESQQFKQKSFLLTVEDKSLNRTQPTFLKSVPALLSKIASDFESLNYDGAKASSRLYNLPCVLNARSAVINISVPDEIPSLGVADAAELVSNLSSKSYLDAATVGLVFLQRFLTQPNFEDRGFLRQLDQFLEVWYGVSAWADIRGPLGQTEIAKLRIAICQMQGQHDRVPQLLGAVASGLFAHGQKRVAREWCEPHYFRFRRPWLLAAIELAVGNLRKARDLFFSSICHPGMDADFYALHFAYYGLCELKLGNISLGMRFLNDAVNAPNLLPTTITRIFRVLGDAYTLLGDHNYASIQFDQAVSIAQSFGIGGQTLKAEARRQRSAAERAPIPSLS